MGNIHDAFPSNYLKASDLQGSQPVVVIDRVEFEAVGRERERKPILYFVGKEKGMVLNKTNANNVANLAGTPETNDWNGVRVRLYSTHVEFQGDTVEAIRIKAAPVQAAARVAAPAPAPVAAPVVTREPGSDDAPEVEGITDKDIPF